MKTMPINHIPQKFNHNLKYQTAFDGKEISGEVKKHLVNSGIENFLYFLKFASDEYILKRLTQCYLRIHNKYPGNAPDEAYYPGCSVCGQLVFEKEYKNFIERS